MKELELMPLLSSSNPAWVEVVMADFDAFLLDHAACERKASALAMSFVVKYPDRPQLIEPMICIAREELAHFHDVYCLILKRGLQLAPDEKDPYLNLLLKHVRHGREEHLMDRLIISSVVEARGCERFKLVGDALTDPELKKFYGQLARIEAGHYKVFLNIARQYSNQQDVERRLKEILDIEATAIASLELRAAVH